MTLTNYATLAEFAHNRTIQYQNNFVVNKDSEIEQNYVYKKHS